MYDLCITKSRDNEINLIRITLLERFDIAQICTMIT